MICYTTRFLNILCLIDEIDWFFMFLHYFQLWTIEEVFCYAVVGMTVER